MGGRAGHRPRKQLHASFRWRLHPVRCRVLSLVAKVSHGAYPKGHVWDIPEYRLDRAVNSLKRRPGFKERCRLGTLSMQDAEDIIYLASHKLIRLELEM